MKTVMAFVILTAALLTTIFFGNRKQAPVISAEKPKPGITMNQTLETATFGGGCFWCTEAIFESLIGVEDAKSGYSGGTRENPTYEQVSSGASGHVEVIEVVFDSSKITFEDILKVFFHTHDPTTLNQQGFDKGTQYRSVIFYHSAAQKTAAELVKSRIDAEKLWPNPIVTTIEPITKFYDAEQYHQDYFKNNPNQPYCDAVIVPKMQKLYKEFGDKIRRAG